MVARDRHLLEMARVDGRNTLEQLGPKTRKRTKTQLKNNSSDMKRLITENLPSLIEAGVGFVSVDHKHTGPRVSNSEDWAIAVIVIVQHEDLFASYMLQFVESPNTSKVTAEQQFLDILKVNLQDR